MQLSGRASFISLALSDDHKMGLDSAIECVNDYGQVKVFTSMTRAIPNNFGARRSEIVSQNLVFKFPHRLNNFMSNRIKTSSDSKRRGLKTAQFTVELNETQYQQLMT